MAQPLFKAQPPSPHSRRLGFDPASFLPSSRSLWWLSPRRPGKAAPAATAVATPTGWTMVKTWSLTCGCAPWECALSGRRWRRRAIGPARPFGLSFVSTTTTLAVTARQDLWLKRHLIRYGAHLAGSLLFWGAFGAPLLWVLLAVGVVGYCYQPYAGCGPGLESFLGTSGWPPARWLPCLGWQAMWQRCWAIRLASGGAGGIARSWAVSGSSARGHMEPGAASHA